MKYRIVWPVGKASLSQSERCATHTLAHTPLFDEAVGSDGSKYEINTMLMIYPIYLCFPVQRAGLTVHQSGYHSQKLLFDVLRKSWSNRLDVCSDTLHNIYHMHIFIHVTVLGNIDFTLINKKCTGKQKPPNNEIIH